MENIEWTEPLVFKENTESKRVLKTSTYQLKAARDWRARKMQDPVWVAEMRKKQELFNTARRAKRAADKAAKEANQMSV
tara:strand:+ start:42 stop:278 length:237 start_codon:yes stop_codon:yes gene_type:complete